MIFPAPGADLLDHCPEEKARWARRNSAQVEMIQMLARAAIGAATRETEAADRVHHRPPRKFIKGRKSSA